MYALQFIAGIGEDKNGQPLHDLERKLETIREELATTFGGYTEQAASGGWINGQGRLVKEPSVVWTTVTNHAKRERGLNTARFIAAQLNQESVLFNSFAIDSEFIGA